MIDTPRLVKTFECHGFDADAKAGDEFVGLCPFCQHPSRKFFVNGETGQYHCKNCGHSGNIPRFLTERSKQCLLETSDSRYRRLAKYRGLPVKAFKRFKVAWDGVQWLLPCYRGTGMVADIRRWSKSGGKIRSTTGCQTQLFGGAWLERYEVSRGGIVWVCEGEWDAIALAELLSQAGRKDDAVVAMPGADTFKRPWLEWFGGHHVRLCYDNDGAGDRGSMKAGKLLDGVARKVEYICWPDTLKNGYDLRDFIVGWWGKGKKSKIVYERLCKLLHKKHRRTESVTKKAQKESIIVSMPERPKFLTLKPTQRPSFDRVVDVFSGEVLMDDEMIACLRFTLALCLTEQLDGPALWSYIVGPPGCGKTLILCALQESDRVLFRSSIGPKCLISGFGKRGDTANDPSILAQIHSKILVNKDATEMFSQMQPIVYETQSIMRGAYDGHVSRSFGNGVLREYYMHFSCVMGVTGIVNTFPGATMGERFLKFHFREQLASEREARVEAAILSTGMEAQSDSRMRKVVAKFLARNDTERIKPPLWLIKRMMPLVNFVSHLRGTVSRSFKEELTMEPEKEYPTRVAKQLTKLAMGLAFVDNRTVIHPTDWDTVKRIAMDTVFGIHSTMVGKLYTAGGSMLLRKLEDASGIPRTTLYRRCSDLIVLKIVSKYALQKSEQDALRGAKGGAPHTVRITLTDEIMEKIQSAGLVFD